MRPVLLVVASPVLAPLAFAVLAILAFASFPGFVLATVIGLFDDELAERIYDCLPIEVAMRWRDR